MSLSGVVSLFHRQHEAGLFPAGQLVVRRSGQVLLDEVVGEGVTEETPFQVMSASKPVVAFVIAMLEDQGKLDAAQPVSRYLPEIGASPATVLDVLTHRSGIGVPSLRERHEQWADWDRVIATICAAPAFGPRGRIAYAPHEFGWILGEIARRASGRSLPELLPDELSGLRFAVPADEVGRVARTRWLGPASYQLGGSDLARVFEDANNAPSTLTSLVPGASMVTTARDLARFYEVVLRGGAPYLRDGTLARYTSLAASGRDRSTGAWVRLGRGFALGWSLPHAYGWWGTGACHGHAGGFSTVAWADPTTGAAVAIVTSGNRGVGDMVKRFAPLGSAIRRALKS